MLRLILCEPFAREIEQEDYSQPYCIYNRQTIAKVRRTEMKNRRRGIHDLGIVVTGSVEKNHCYGMYEVEMKDIVKERHFAIYRYDFCEFITHLFQQGQQDTGRSKCHGEIQKGRRVFARVQKGKHVIDKSVSFYPRFRIAV